MTINDNTCTVQSHHATTKDTVIDPKAHTKLYLQSTPLKCRSIQEA